MDVGRRVNVFIHSIDIMIATAACTGCLKSLALSLIRSFIYKIESTKVVQVSALFNV